MITEQYVSFETAKLLKEKGFDENCIYVYLHDGSEDLWDADKEDIECQKPTQALAMRWLREVHHCFIQIKEYFQLKQYQAFVDVNGKSTYCEPDWFHPIANSYEEACEAAIQYCIKNLI